MIGTLVMTSVGRSKMRLAWRAPPITISDTRLPCCRPSPLLSSPLHIYSAPVEEESERDAAAAAGGAERIGFSLKISFPTISCLIRPTVRVRVRVRPSIEQPAAARRTAGRTDERTDGLPFRSLSSSLSPLLLSRCSLVPVVLERAYFKSILGMS